MPIAVSERFIVIVLIMFSFTSCAELGIYWPNRQAPGNPGRGGDAEVSVSVGISAREARGLAVGHGLIGMRALPPGIKRNLARGKPLPPGIARQLVPGSLL